LQNIPALSKVKRKKKKEVESRTGEKGPIIKSIPACAKDRSVSLFEQRRSFDKANQPETETTILLQNGTWKAIKSEKRGVQFQRDSYAPNKAVNEALNLNQVLFGNGTTL